MKKYVLSWAVAGVAAPLLLAAISHFVLPPPPPWNPWVERKISPLEHKFAVATACVYPAIFVEEVLALLVTDSGGDSGAGFAGAVLFTISMLLNAAYFVVIGLLLRFLAAPLFTLFKNRAPG
jgi:hypothetical protein